LSLGLGLAVPNVWFSSSHPDAAVKTVSVLDVSGEPLRSLFDGLKADPNYREFKQVSAGRLLGCRRHPDRISRFWQLLGLSFDPVVQAQACGGCGNTINDWFQCVGCGDDLYDGPLDEANLDMGIMTGPTVCTTGDPFECPGEGSTDDCSCYTCGTYGTSCWTNDDCCSGICDDSDFFCH
jgi:hypothetical protein